MQPIFKYFLIFCLLALVAFLVLSKVVYKNKTETTDPGLAESQIVSYAGTVTNVNTDPMAYDGPGLITFLGTDGQTRTVATPSMGRNLCTAKDSIADIYNIKVGDQIQVRGEQTVAQGEEEGHIYPCMGSTDYLRVVSSAQPQAKLPAGSKPPATQQSILGTWVWEKTLMNDDSVITPKKVGVFSLTLTADGKVSGKTDCNGFSGSYQVGTDGIISFGPLASTMMYCEGSQEAVFTKQISDSTSYTTDAAGNLVLLLKYDSGSVLFKK